jgi:hypothetical protein
MQPAFIGLEHSFITRLSIQPQRAFGRLFEVWTEPHATLDQPGIFDVLEHHASDPNMPR